MVFFLRFLPHLFIVIVIIVIKVFINIHKYANEIIYISDYRKKGIYISFNLVPSLVL